MQVSTLCFIFCRGRVSSSGVARVYKVGGRDKLSAKGANTVAKGSGGMLPRENCEIQSL